MARHECAELAHRRIVAEVLSPGRRARRRYTGRHTLHAMHGRGAMALILFVGSDLALLEGLAQTLAAAGERVRITQSLHDNDPATLAMYLGK